jgi:type II secretory ATPase GspE/PulE/Tfp pilus assembly ATPase PilB-like protein
MSPEHHTRVHTELARGAGISIIHLVDGIIEDGHALRASDIHVEPGPEAVEVRMRIDGVLGSAYTIPKHIHSEIISRIKILAGLRTDEHQAAQDGRFRVEFSLGRPIDIRVSIIPTYYGENTVLRLLADNQEELALEALGFSVSDVKKIRRAIARPHGMILATGPTGSGKTTTLYTLIKMLGSRETSIVTIEDPIEYAIPGITQIQVNSRHGLTFATGLRSILRQDPNIIMVGEIRDSETASIAVNTALTGHLLLSTLHTSDAATTLPRLLDMGVEPYLASSTIHIAIGQRLVRKVCTECKRERKVSNNEREDMLAPFGVLHSEKPMTFFEGAGCSECKESGYRGRIGIHEVLVNDKDIQELLLKKMPANDIRRAAIKNGMTTLVNDGLAKVASGVTTVEEILRVLHE